MYVESVLSSVVLAGGFTGLTLWVGVMAGVMLTALTLVMGFLTLAPRYSDAWAERLGENTDRELAVDYHDVIEDETAEHEDEDAAEPEPEAELEAGQETDAETAEETDTVTAEESDAEMGEETDAETAEETDAAGSEPTA